MPAAGGEGIVVAVPGGHDYIVDAAGVHPVPGSNGADVDLAFATWSASTRPRAGALLAAADRNTGADVVLHCDASMTCTDPTPLAGGQSADVSLVVGSGGAPHGFVLARTATLLYGSHDDGRTFSPIALPASEAVSYTTVAGAAIGPGREAVYVALLRVVQAGASAATTGGVYATQDGGRTWRSVGASSGPLDEGATSIAVAPDGRMLAGYVNSRGRAGLVCSDDGATWRSSCRPLPGGCAPPCADAQAADAALGAAAPRTLAAPVESVDALVPRETSASSSFGQSAAATQSRDHGAHITAVMAAVTIVVVALLVSPLNTLRRRRRRGRTVSSR
jgi:hypothetical protein